MKLEQAARQALGALVRAEAMYGQPNADIQTALREALSEQAEQEPVATVVQSRPDTAVIDVHAGNVPLQLGTKLYAVPVQQAEQEPVAWMTRNVPVTPNWKSTVNSSETALYCKPLYTRPVRTKDLTDEEIRELFANEKQVYAEEGISFARAVITKFKEKNK